MPRRTGIPLGTGLRYFLTVLVGMSVSMLIAYATVRTLTRGTTFVVELSPAERDRAWALRESANELARLANEFQDAIPAQGAPPAIGTLRWLRAELPERLRALDSTLTNGPLGKVPEAQALHAAGERLKVLALHPQDAPLRTATLEEIRRAIEGIDEYLNAPQRRGHIALPTIPLR